MVVPAIARLPGVYALLRWPCSGKPAGQRHTTAVNPSDPMMNPAISPDALMPAASLQVSPGRGASGAGIPSRSHTTAVLKRTGQLAELRDAGSRVG